MDIYLDFDGTVVEHQYPNIGRCNYGCVEVIKKLQDAGHNVILNTMRVEFKDGSLEQALDWFSKAWMCVVDKSNMDDFELKPLSVTTYKHSPAYWNWDFFRDNNMIIIDDQSSGVPLKRAVMTSGYMVDWDEIDRQFKEHGIYE